jgi:DivIVA domain-containing protein
MASSERHGDEPASATETTGAGEALVKPPNKLSQNVTGGERPARRVPGSRVSASERARMLQDARNIDFPAALRGYDRSSVDRYVEEVTRLIAELEISSSPESAVRHALEEVSEETRDLLQRAHQTADEITVRSRARATERLEEAEREAAELRQEVQREVANLREAADRDVAKLRQAATDDAEKLRMTAARDAEEARAAARREADQVMDAAESRAQELSHSAETIWRDRRRLIEDVKAVGEQLVSIGEAESKRFPRFGEPVTPETVRG